LVPINVRFAQTSFQSCITWPKKSSMLTMSNLSMQAL
jgi:hypothetical protein